MICNLPYAFCDHCWAGGLPGNDEAEALELAADQGWHVDGNEHLCPDCTGAVLVGQADQVEE